MSQYRDLPHEWTPYQALLKRRAVHWNSIFDNTQRQSWQTPQPARQLFLEWGRFNRWAQEGEFIRKDATCKCTTRKDVNKLYCKAYFPYRLQRMSDLPKWPRKQFTVDASTEVPWDRYCLRIKTLTVWMLIWLNTCFFSWRNSSFNGWFHFCCMHKLQFWNSLCFNFLCLLGE